MSDGQSMPNVTVTYPSGFAALPFGQSTEDRLQRATSLVEALPAESVTDRESLIRDLATVAQTLSTQGVQQAGQLTLPGGPPIVSATVLLSITALPDGGLNLGSSNSQRTAAEALAEAIQQGQPRAQPQLENLPAGTAVRFERHETFTVPAEHTPERQDRSIPSRSVQYLLPTPDGTALLTLNISTSRVAHWTEFLDQAAVIAASIRFTQGQP